MLFEQRHALLVMKGVLPKKLSENKVLDQILEAAPQNSFQATRSIYLTYSDQYPTRESGDKVACLDKVLLSFVGLQCGSML